MAAIGRNGGAQRVNGDNGGDVVETQNFASLRCDQSSCATHRILPIIVIVYAWRLSGAMVVPIISMVITVATL